MDFVKLIDTVQWFPFLFDPEDKSYTDLEKKDEAWKQIGTVLQQPAPECKKWWYNLRHSYRKALKKKTTASGQRKSKIAKWKYEDEMSFLIPIFNQIKPITSCNIQAGDESNDTSTHEANEAESFLIETINEDGNLSSRPSSPSFQSPVPQTSTLHENTQDNVSAALMDYIFTKRKDSSRQVQNTTGDIDLFFQIITSTVKKFSPYNQAVAKAKIFSVISELEINELSRKEYQQQFPTSTQAPFSEDLLNIKSTSSPPL